ncbi:MAG: hypothetical protein JXA97_09260 [Anaerolineales bacterium]|nr:hypothetical protein [Anaerolineales bacterium]
MNKLRIDMIPWGITALFLLLSGCSSGSVETAAAPSDRIVPATMVPSTETAIPVRNRAVLVGPESHAYLSISKLAETLARRILETGGAFSMDESMETAVVDDTVALIVFVDQPELAGAWAQLNPETQVISIPAYAGEMMDNLLNLGPAAIPLEQIGFLAGYAASLIAPDWRTAILTDVQSDPGDVLENAYYQGGKFFCGLCRPERPPYEDYPLLLNLDPGDESSWQRVSEIIRTAGIDVIYIEPGTLDPDKIAYLEDAGVQWIGSELENYPGSPALLIAFDPASVLEEHWEELMLRPQGGVLPLPLIVVGVREDEVSPGRYAVIRAIGDDLENGFIGIED